MSQEEYSGPWGERINFQFLAAVAALHVGMHALLLLFAFFVKVFQRVSGEFLVEFINEYALVNISADV